MSNLLRVLALNVLRVVFIGGIVLVLAASLRWALNPAAAPQINTVTDIPIPRVTPEDDAPAAAAPAATVAPSPVPTATIDPAVLIAAAEPPTDTTVQVLDAGGGPANLDRAVAAMEDLGYDVVNVTSSSRDVTATTIYYVGEHEPEARALRARDPRFQAIEPNQGLSQGVDLHVLVGSEF